MCYAESGERRKAQEPEAGTNARNATARAGRSLCACGFLSSLPALVLFLSFRGFAVFVFCFSLVCAFARVFRCLAPLALSSAKKSPLFLLLPPFSCPLRSALSFSSPSFLVWVAFVVLVAGCLLVALVSGWVSPSLVALSRPVFLLFFHPIVLSLVCLRVRCAALVGAEAGTQPQHEKTDQKRRNPENRPPPVFLSPRCARSLPGSPLLAFLCPVCGPQKPLQRRARERIWKDKPGQSNPFLSSIRRKGLQLPKSTRLSP
jgi:hypothetical protein